MLRVGNTHGFLIFVKLLIKLINRTDSELEMRTFIVSTCNAFGTDVFKFIFLKLCLFFRYIPQRLILYLQQQHDLQTSPR